MITIKTFPFVNAHLTASKEGELADQNAAFKIIALKDILIYIIYRISHGFGMDVILFQRIVCFLSTSLGRG